jgi:hypothetical protein
VLRRLAVFLSATALTLTTLTACTGGASHPAAGGVPPAPAPAAPTASGSVTDPVPTGSLDVHAENALPGSNAWKPGIDAGDDHGIEGFADAVEVTAGQPFHLYVNTIAPQYTATAFRIGYYAGQGGRQVWKSAAEPGTVQPPATVQPGVNTVDTSWRPSVTVPTTGWPEGDYLIRLDPVGAPGGRIPGSRFVPLTVRSTSTAGKVVLINGVTTWQAYNLYGGYDLYSGPKPQLSYAQRARIVSFDRPYDTTGADRFQNYEQSSVTFAEQTAAAHNLQLAYATDVDLHANPGLFQGAAAIITLGHDEYWSTQMRATLTKARDSGTNLAFLGANAIFRHIRYADSPLGKDRVEIDYKDAAEDPMHLTDPTEATQDWRYAPDPRPENVLTGGLYECFPGDADYVVYDPTSWLLAGTGAVKGTKIKGLVGVEYDRIVNDPSTPHPIQALSHSPLKCRGKASFSDSSYYTVPSGAGVFATGTMRWNCALVSGGCSKMLDAGSYRFAQTVTATMLVAFAAGPAGTAHPAVDDTLALKPAPEWGGAAP